VDAAHRQGLGVILDVVYNHLGPDGNYLGCFSAGYFTDRWHTPWGWAVNFASPAVREFFVANALSWVLDYHVDGLRLDATHHIHDTGRVSFLGGLARSVREAVARHRPVLIAEDDRNDARLVRPAGRRGGRGLDAVWADDLHHQLQVALTGDDDGYYRNYGGTPRAIARTLRRGWYFEGQRYPASGAARGTSPAGLPAHAFVHCLQNHDQIGNRALGERLHHIIDPAAWRAAGALVLLSPYTPLLFMGQEWGATSPFLYFTDHEPDLGAKVTAGRRQEFRDFKAFRAAGARARIPDPQGEDTFRRSRLNREERELPHHAALERLHRDLLRLRQSLPAVPRTARAFSAGTAGRTAVWYRRRVRGRDVLVVTNLRGTVRLRLGRDPWRAARGRPWILRLSSEDAHYGGEPERVRLDAARGVLTLRGPAAAVLESGPA
jgi:maltooligosyltrehalose trehalohydrolase